VNEKDLEDSLIVIVEDLENLVNNVKHQYDAGVVSGILMVLEYLKIEHELNMNLPDFFMVRQ